MTDEERERHHIPDAGKMVPTLTDAEREAIDIAESWLPPQCQESAATLHHLWLRVARDDPAVRVL